MEEERGFFGRMWDHMKERFAAIPSEVGDMVDHKISQGAAELSRALMSEANCYEPYGYGQRHLNVEPSYEDMLREASQRAVPDHERGLER